MKNQVVNVNLYGEKIEMEVVIFEKGDTPLWKEMFGHWLKLKNSLRVFGAREPNIPEGISEIAYCIFSGSVRKAVSDETKTKAKKTKSPSSSSFDTFNIQGNRAEQIKACSVEDDLTSFGPKSKWDDLIFMDFYNGGIVDGTFSAYRIPTDLIYKSKVNRRSTFLDFQKAGKRPRLSIKKVILESGIMPFAENIRIWELSSPAH